MNYIDKKKYIIDYAKNNGEFYPAGSIVPQRILKCERKHSSKKTFISNTWCIPTKLGYLCVCRYVEGFCLKLANVNNGNFFGSPYIKRGATYWLDSDILSPAEGNLIADLYNCVS